LALAWFRRDALNPNGLWWWFKGQTQLALETPYTDFALLQVNNEPVLIGVAQQGELTGVVVQFWGQEPQTIFQTKLNVGALAANAVAGKIGIVFAEGYRNTQDEKYDLRFLQLVDQKIQSRLIAPAVYLGRDQRFGVALKSNQFIPIWWYETPDEQRLAGFTKQHHPRLAFFEAGKIIEFAPPVPYLGQLGSALYYIKEDQIISYNLETKVTQVEITAPSGFSSADLSYQRVPDLSSQQRSIAWQSLEQDGFRSQLWFADSNQPFSPSLIDQISKVLGWNPWFPVQNFFGQSALSLVLAALAVLLVAPIVWLLRGRFDFGQGTWFGMVCAWVVLLGGRVVSSGFNAGNWVFAPLVNVPWQIVLLGTAVGSGLVFWQRKRLNGIELGATISVSLVVLVSTFIIVFSRIGFLKF
jgi:hypothetical protein